MQTDVYRGAINSESNSEEDAYAIMTHLISGNASESERDEFLRRNLAGSINAREIYGYARAIRNHSGLKKISGITDIVGTGGDGKNTVNVSTASAIAASALGIRIAKHGNRGVTSRHGSADFMEYIGYDLKASPERIYRNLTVKNFAFLLAPQFNSAFAAFSEARKRIGRRTVFNVLGPLTNPLDPDRMILGAFSRETAEIYAEVMRIGSKTGFTFSSMDGMDEISPFGETYIIEVRKSGITKRIVNGENLIGCKVTLGDISEPDPEKCFRKTIDGLTGKNAAISRFIALNTAPALVANGTSETLEDAIDTVMQAIESGKVADQIKRIRG